VFGWLSDEPAAERTRTRGRRLTVGFTHDAHGQRRMGRERWHGSLKAQDVSATPLLGNTGGSGPDPQGRLVLKTAKQFVLDMNTRNVDDPSSLRMAVSVDGDPG
jgi:hypothetical protein